MPRITAFKAHLPRGPARTATPPPPQYEPLSPVLQPAVAVAVAAAAAHPAASQSAHAPTTLALPPQHLPHPQHAQHPHHAHTHHSHSHPHLQQPHPHILPPSPWALGSPIEALADAAAATAAPAPVQRTSPAYIEPPPLHKHGRTASSSLVDARPAKRARSELYHASPPHAHHYDRPATSHIPGWSYNVEHMSDAGMRVYHDPVESTDNRISDAQLLLDFFQVSAHTAQTPPSTAKRWSISHPAPPEQHIHQQPQPPPPPPPPHYPLHAHHLPHTHAHVHTHHHTHPHPHVHAHTLSHTPHTSSGPLPPLPLDVALPAPAVQTHTPPEEVPGLPQSLPYDTADPKPKKHQGWPKGKPRGPRTTPSTSKRKKSTPKPKSAPSTSTSTASDQLQSPQSLPADHASAAAPARATLPTSDEAIAQRDPPPRHRSLSNTLLAPPGDILSSGAARSQSVPLHAALSVPPPADTLGHAAKTRPPQQPELICAACHSSDSAVKVGDGEQWIGCDGCKEWHHYACAGFSSEREVRDVNKFYCEPCRPRFGETTSRSTDAHWNLKSDLVQRFANPSELTPRLTTPA
jgi:F-box/leucine-rich repeat protein 10/11